MRKILVALSLLSMSASASSAQYGHYHLDEVLVRGSSNGAASPIVNFGKLNKILNDLNTHAGATPVRFDSPEDVRRAQADATELSKMLDPLARLPKPDLRLLQSAASLNAIGIHLNVPGATERAEAAFRSLMSQAPDDARANYLYGKFLFETGKPHAAIAPLEKAQSLGVVYADYVLGMAYLSAGENDKALPNLEHYSKRVPGDTQVIKTIAAIRSSPPQ
jgi:predicted Zn-dependent protease